MTRSSRPGWWRRRRTCCWSARVIRPRAGEVKQSGRQTMGVRLMNLAAGDSVVGLARNAESLAEGDHEPTDEDDDQGLSAEFPEDPADLTDGIEGSGSGDSGNEE